jgi:hypothetical protein
VLAAIVSSRPLPVSVALLMVTGSLPRLRHTPRRSLVVPISVSPKSSDSGVQESTALQVPSQFPLSGILSDGV